MDFNTYQKEAFKTNEQSRRGASAVLGLAGEVGSVQSLFKKRLRHKGPYPSFNKELVEELGDALWYLAAIASVEDISLDEIARLNLAKTKALFAEGDINRFDSGYPRDEQFPRKFQVEFLEKTIGDKVQVKISMNDVTIGDTLTDNAYGQDGYRYHDAFHLAYCAVLGWSPVTRALLRRKRKSNPEIDEVEDGQRAQIVEEAIANFVFAQAETENDYSDPKSISFGLVQIIQRLASQLEVKTATVKQWQKAIAGGFVIFRLLLEHRGGTVSLDLDSEGIEFQPPKTDVAESISDA